MTFGASAAVHQHQYFRVSHMGISFLISLNNLLLKNLPHVGSFRHFIICCMCVFLYLYFCIYLFYTWEYNFWYHWTILFSKICHFVICSICVFVFVYLCVRHLVISVLISLDQELSENIWVYGLRHHIKVISGSRFLAPMDRHTDTRTKVF